MGRLCFASSQGSPCRVFGATGSVIVLANIPLMNDRSHRGNRLAGTLALPQQVSRQSLTGEWGRPERIRDAPSAALLVQATIRVLARLNGGQERPHL